MIARLAGTVAVAGDGRLVVDVGGVGYAVATPRRLSASARVGEEVALATHLHVAEGVLDLYGFEDEHVRAFFLLLLSVAGIGPKLALSIVDQVPVPALAAALAEGKTDVVVQVPGVGKKLAERMVLELRGKVGEFIGGAHATQLNVDADIVEALRTLGYKREEIASALKLVDESIEGVEERLKATLRYLRKS